MQQKNRTVYSKLLRSQLQQLLTQGQACFIYAHPLPPTCFVQKEIPDFVSFHL